MDFHTQLMRLKRGYDDKPRSVSIMDSPSLLMAEVSTQHDCNLK